MDQSRALPSHPLHVACRFPRCSRGSLYIRSARILPHGSRTAHQPHGECAQSKLHEADGLEGSEAYPHRRQAERAPGDDEEGGEEDGDVARVDTREEG